jgi:hypothetical protein
MLDSVEIQVGGHIGNSQQFVALVDAADAEMVGAYLWSMSKGYAQRNDRSGGRHLIVRMHRFLLDLGCDDPDVDHINGDKLDNRRENLRVCTIAQNNQNRHDRPYRGAHWHVRRNRWQANVRLDRKDHYLGLFDTREEAAAVASAFRREHMPFSVQDKVIQAGESA